MQALQTVVSKHALRSGEVSKSELFCFAAVYACVLLLPLALAIESWRIELTNTRLRSVVGGLTLNGLCSFVNQYTGLTVLDAMSTPLSHALANVMKRAVVITAALIYASRSAASHTGRPPLLSSPRAPPLFSSSPCAPPLLSHAPHVFVPLLLSVPQCSHALSQYAHAICPCNMPMQALSHTHAYGCLRPVSLLHVCGVGLSVFGAVAYQQARLAPHASWVHAHATHYVGG